MPSLIQSQPGTSTTSPVSITLPNPTSAGNCLIVCFTGSASPTNPTVSGITLGGSAGNFAQAATVGNPSVDSTTTSQWADPNCAGGQTAVSVSWTGSAGSVDVLVMEWNGIITASPVDKTISNIQAAVTSWSSTATATTTQAVEVIIGCVGGFNGTAIGTITGPSSPWTNLAQVTSASTHLGLLAGWQSVLATGAFTYSGSFASSSDGTSLVVTYKALLNNPQPPPPRLIAPGWRAPSKLVQRQPPPPAPPAAIVPGSATLDGSGSFGATGTIVKPGAAALDGSGSLSATGSTRGAHLTGQGDLRAYEEVQYAALTGSGTLRAYEQVKYAALSGSGTLGLALTLGLSIGLSGFGFMFIPQVTGGLVNGIGGGGLSQAFPGSSQVAVAPPGSTNWQWLGTLGQVTALKYSFTIPGGCDKMSMTIMAPAAYRTQLFNPGWQVKITRGGHTVWDGKLDEPQTSASGWSLTAVGTGNRGQDFLAIYNSTWPASEPDESVNNAISRGLPWVNRGIGTPSGIWLGQSVDSGAQTVTALLNLACTRGGLTWYVNSQPGGAYTGADLTVFPLPTAVNRLLVCTQPVSRTLGGDINTIFIRYQSSGDNATAGTSATYAVTSVQNAQSVAQHGVIETFIDLSDVGTQTAGQAQAVGNNVLAIYQRASFAGPFTVSYGQLLNAGGTPVDPGTDQAGTVCRLILTDFGYGGEVTPGMPITFLVGSYEWDDFAQTATVTPYQSVDQSLTGLLSMENTVLTPIKAAST